MSKKRILPAIALAGTVGFIGLHRLYAGRYVTGLLQLILFSVGVILLKPDIAGITSIQTLDDYMEWASAHTIHPLPILLVAIPSFWAIYDCVLLLARRFKDGAGYPLTTWI